VKSVQTRLLEVQSATREYVKAHARRDETIILGRIDGCTIEQLAESARLSTDGVLAILGEPT
jgi:hypothetical protein